MAGSMTRTTMTCSIPICLLVALTMLAPGIALAHDAHRPPAANVVVPQRRAFRLAAAGAVDVTRVDVAVSIVDQVATTTMDVSLANTGSTRAEAELVVPVPDGVAVVGFTYQGNGVDVTAKLLPRDEARRIYDAIVAQARDPALLEFIDFSLIRSSVFPVEAGATQVVRLTYEQILKADADRVDYVLPRSAAIDYAIPWKVKVSVKDRRPVSTIYSPTHEIEKQRIDDRAFRAQIVTAGRTEPGPFRLSYLLQQADGVSASVIGYPDPSVGGGYFLLLAGLPADEPKGAPAIRREVTLVLDRSGSMNGEKLDQVREAALQILAGLEDGEAFNVIIYNEAVEMLSPRPVIKSRETIAAARRYLEGLRARGGTNIHDALLEALRQEPVEKMLPLVLFLTDGLPTIGETSERRIRALATSANHHQRRVFTFGVGVDVNSPLLESLAWETRATSTFVLPGQDVEVKVAGVFRRLAGPVLAGGKLRVLDEKGEPAIGRVRDVIPARLPDLFQGDQLILLGQYIGTEPVGIEIAGNFRGAARQFRFDFAPESASSRHDFVPRLWASRKIGLLIDAIRSSGADTSPFHRGGHDPKMQELIDEVIRLSTQFGILTEYTAFLAREGTDLSDRVRVQNDALTRFDQRAVRSRSGMAGINQESNLKFYKGQYRLNIGNNYLNDRMEEVSIHSCQQVNDRAFYRKSNQWVDSRLAGDAGRAAAPNRVVTFGTDEHLKLARHLAQQRRQGAMALPGDVLLEVDGEVVLVRNP